MENFTISTQLTAKDYARITLTSLYKKPGMILAAIVGTYLVFAEFFDEINVVHYDTPHMEIILGSFLVLFPLLIVLIGVKEFNSDTKYRGSIKYTFDENGMLAEGKTFKSEYMWAHIMKQREIGNYLILQHTKRTASFLDKTKLSAEQLSFIKNKVNRK